MPERLHLRVQRPFGAWSVVGIANWSDVEIEATFDPAEFQLEPARYHLVDLWTGTYLGMSSQPVDLGQLPPHAMRLLSVHPEHGRPQTIGSTGHLLGEAMDLADEVWDGRNHTLTLVPASASRLPDSAGSPNSPRRVIPPSRTGEFLIYDPNGLPRRIPFSASDPRPMRVPFE
jgi:hypothetical protein